jgi:hypothetical protein
MSPSKRSSPSSPLAPASAGDDLDLVRSMRPLALAALVLLVTRTVGQNIHPANPAFAQSLRPSPPYRLIDLLQASLHFFDPAQISVERKVDLFRKSIIDPHQEAFRVAPGATDEQTLEDFFRSDKNLESYLQNSLSSEPEMRKLSDEFPTLLYACWSRLHSRLPRLNGDVTIYLVPAPLDTVGGCVRPVGPRNVVVFGSEVLAHRRTSPLRFDVFVTHELFHLYHIQANPEMRTASAGYFMGDSTTPPPKLYQMMWLEGLAVYASQVLNPHATMKEAWVSSDPLSEVKARLRPLSISALKELDSTDKRVIHDFVFGGNKERGIPNGTGYYLGMLAAKRLATRYRLEDLANLQGSVLRDAIERELNQVIKPAIQIDSR